MDYPQGKGIVDLSDKQHPKYGLTRLNESSKFLSIAREVRLMIYEYAVYINEEIEPIQVEPCSNQFVFKRYLPDPPYTLREKQPTVASLTRVCRAIYAEFEHFQPFYKIHTFSFTEMVRLRIYIAAITPSRRQAIRRISYKPSELFDHWLLSKRIFEMDPQYPVDHGTLTILSQTGLEEFTLVKTIPDELPPGTTAADELRDELREVRKYPDGLHTTRNLPCFRLAFDIDPPNETEITDRLIEQISKAVEVRRQRIGTDTPKWFKQLKKFRCIENAMREVSDLDILGEDRVALNRVGSTFGPVSSRTRNKCRLPNSIGQRVKSRPRYSADGILTTFTCKMYDIRWDGTDVQCLVCVYPRVEDKVWEDISALLVPENIYHIIRFYRDIMSQDDPSRLAEIKSKPTLRDIIEIEGGLHFLQHTEEEIRATKKRRRLRQLEPRLFRRQQFIPRRSRVSILRDRWVMCANQWEAYIAKLERERSLEEQERGEPEALGKA
ncbi:hypothetical protein F4774DRAFT_271448 [Daldinia eschscholtzii]|nr:hypothetical protein F4774DRAFT_271448 [Daldinia eschscholtzii]